MDESEIESLLRSNAPGKWEQIKKAASIAQEHRRRVKGGDLFIFLFPLAAAMAKDAFFDFIPVLGTIFGVFITVYLFIFMWGRGRIWLRFVFFIIAVLDLIPFINLIPFNTASVVYAFLRARKDATQSQAALSDMERQAPRLKRKLQTQTARMARATALQEERMQRQTANDTAPTEPTTAPQERSAQASRMASFPASDSATQRAAAPVTATAAVSAAVAGNPVRADDRSNDPIRRSMDGARMQLAQVRGRAANDSTYKESQSARQRAVSGSDVVPDQRPQLVGTLSSSGDATRASAASAPTRVTAPLSVAHISRTPQSRQSASPVALPQPAFDRRGVTQMTSRTSSFGRPQEMSNDATTRIREAGSRLSQLGRSPKEAAAATGAMMPLATPLHQSPDTEVGDYPVQNIGRTKVGLHPGSTNRSMSERNTQTVSITLPGTEQSHLERALPQDFSMVAEQPRIDFQKLLPKVVPEFEHILAQIEKADSKPFVPSYEGQVRPKNLNKMMLEILGFSEEEIGKLVSAGKEGHLQEDLDRMLHQEEADTRALLANPKFKETLNRCESALSKMVEKAGVTSYAEIAPKALHLGKLGLALAEQNMSGKLQMHYLGRYLPAANSIIVLHPEGNDSDKAVHIRVHETLHGLSYNPERATKEFEDITDADDMKEGGVTRDSKKLGMILNPLNEGITEYFAQKISKQAGIKNPDAGDYQDYVGSVDSLIEYIARTTNKDREEVEDEIFAAYSKKTGVLHIGKMLERHVGPGSLRLMQMIPGKFSIFIKTLEQYKSGVADTRLSLHISTLDNSGTTAQKIIKQYPFIQFTKDVYVEGKGEPHFEKEVVYSKETLQDSA